MIRLFSIALALAVAACGTAKGGGMGGPNMNNKLGAAEGEYHSPVVSWDILDREPLANEVKVKHILIGWKALSDAYSGQLDARAAARERSDAEHTVKDLVAQLAAGADFDTLMKANSEDAGSAASGEPFTVTPDAQLVIEFRQLSLRLKPGEVGVCQSDFGFHIIKRM